MERGSFARGPCTIRACRLKRHEHLPCLPSDPVPRARSRNLTTSMPREPKFGGKTAVSRPDPPGPGAHTSRSQPRSTGPRPIRPENSSAQPLDFHRSPRAGRARRRAARVRYLCSVPTWPGTACRVSGRGRRARIWAKAKTVGGPAARMLSRKSRPWDPLERKPPSARRVTDRHPSHSPHSATATPERAMLRPRVSPVARPGWLSPSPSSRGLRCLSNSPAGQCWRVQPGVVANRGRAGTR